MLKHYSPKYLERLSEKGARNAPSVNSAGIRRVKWAGKPLFGNPQGYAAAVIETISDSFRETV